MIERETPAIVRIPATDTVTMHAEDVGTAVATYLRAAAEQPPNGRLMAAALQSTRARIARLESAHRVWVNAHYTAPRNESPWT